jgi:hypothetical protein
LIDGVVLEAVLTGAVDLRRHEAGFKGRAGTAAIDAGLFACAYESEYFFDEALVDEAI